MPCEALAKSRRGMELSGNRCITLSTSSSSRSESESVSTGGRLGFLGLRTTSSSLLFDLLLRRSFSSSSSSSSEQYFLSRTFFSFRRGSLSRDCRERESRGGRSQSQQGKSPPQGLEIGYERDRSHQQLGCFHSSLKQCGTLLCVSYLFEGL